MAFTRLLLTAANTQKYIVGSRKEDKISVTPGEGTNAKLGEFNNDQETQRDRSNLETHLCCTHVESIYAPLSGSLHCVWCNSLFPCKQCCKHPLLYPGHFWLYLQYRELLFYRTLLETHRAEASAGVAATEARRCTRAAAHGGGCKRVTTAHNITIAVEQSLCDRHVYCPIRGGAAGRRRRDRAVA